MAGCAKQARRRRPTSDAELLAQIGELLTDVLEASQFQNKHVCYSVHQTSAMPYDHVRPCRYS